MNDPYNLERFVLAQNLHGTYERALDELRRAEKQSHWMWFVFPQIAGLGQSPMSRRYAIGSLDEARAFLQYQPLGERLIECSSIVAETISRTAKQIFGEVDALKLRSSMTLFFHAAPCSAVFAQVLDCHFGGVRDLQTELLI